MFERTDLEALATYQGKHPVVSLYLNMPPQMRGTTETYRARVKSLLRQANGRAPRSDVAVIERYFDREFDWSGRSLAIFSSQADGLWKVYKFAVPLRSYIHVGQKPFIMPLADLIDTYGSYTVALLDQQTMKVVHFYLGDSIAEAEFIGSEVHNLSAVRGKVVRGQDPTSHKKDMARSNWRQFADELESFALKHKATALVLGGSETNAGQFGDYLSPQWRGKVVGACVLPINALLQDIRDRSLEVLQEHEKAQQEHLIANIRTAAAKASNGAVGFEATLLALQEGRVQTLALIEGLSVPGYHCDNCGYLAIMPNEMCPMCSHDLAPVQNAAEHAVRAVVDQGGIIEFLEEESPLKKEEGMAALLRY